MFDEFHTVHEEFQKKCGGVGPFLSSLSKSSSTLIPDLDEEFEELHREFQNILQPTTKTSDAVNDLGKDCKDGPTVSRQQVSSTNSSDSRRNGNELVLDPVSSKVVDPTSNGARNLENSKSRNATGGNKNGEDDLAGYYFDDSRW